MTAAAAHLRVMPSPLTTYALLRSPRVPGARSTTLTSTHSLPPLCYVITADASLDANGCTKLGGLLIPFLTVHLRTVRCARPLSPFIALLSSCSIVLSIVLRVLVSLLPLPLLL